MQHRSSSNSRLRTEDTCRVSCICISSPRSRCRAVVACMHMYMLWGEWKTAPDRFFVHRCRQVYTRGQVLLTLRHLLVIILTSGCTYALVYAFFFCTVQSLYYMRVYHGCFLTTCMRGWEGVGSGVFFSLSMVGACCWRGKQCFGRGRDGDFVLYISLFLRVSGWWVGVCLHTRIHIH